MASARKRLQALEDAAREREMTPLAWWIGEAHHDEVREELQADDDVALELEGDRLAAIGNREVKVLSESPRRFALWCEEGALDL